MSFFFAAAATIAAAAAQGHLLPNFRTYNDLYKDKEARQKALKEQLLKQKGAIEAGAGDAMGQRTHFIALSKLLSAKVNRCSPLAPQPPFFSRSQVISHRCVALGS